MATDGPACKSCHQAIDPFGYALENFDALGEYRVEDQGLPVDTSGAIANPEDNSQVAFENFAALVPQLAHACATMQGLASASYVDALVVTQQVPMATIESGRDVTERQRVARAFSAGGGSYSALASAIAQSAAILK